MTSKEYGSILWLGMSKGVLISYNIKQRFTWSKDCNRGESGIGGELFLDFMLLVANMKKILMLVSNESKTNEKTNFLRVRLSNREKQIFDFFRARYKTLALKIAYDRCHQSLLFSIIFLSSLKLNFFKKILSIQLLAFIHTDWRFDSMLILLST